MSGEQKNKSFPRYAHRILKHFLPDYDFPYVIGVYEKEYRDRKKNRGRNSAWLWLVLQMLKACPPFFRLKYGGELVQIHNFIKTAKRNFIRHKLMPALEQEYGGSLIEDLFNLSKSAQGFYKQVCNYADGLQQEVAKTDENKVTLDLRKFSVQPEAVGVSPVGE